MVLLENRFIHARFFRRRFRDFTLAFNGLGSTMERKAQKSDVRLPTHSSLSLPPQFFEENGCTPKKP